MLQRNTFRREDSEWSNTPTHPHLECANPGMRSPRALRTHRLHASADVVSAFNLAQLGGWTQDSAGRLLAYRWQPVSWVWWRHPVKTWNPYDEAANDINGHLSGQHNLVHEQQGYFDRLAAAINAL
ncbi:hypothetical protein ACQP1O_18285 [Nocardia sp. CA-151230]|uniref:hypothetical protein n=1 Tax=Nocardia sp. CA-151230 TaxID=3239982 RepID=UPI003D8E3AF6